MGSLGVGGGGYCSPKNGNLWKFLVLMNAHVLFQGCGLVISFPTLVAHIRFLSRVRLHMFLQA